MARCMYRLVSVIMLFLVGCTNTSVSSFPNTPFKDGHYRLPSYTRTDYPEMVTDIFIENKTVIFSAAPLGNYIEQRVVHVPGDASDEQITKIYRNPSEIQARFFDKSIKGYNEKYGTYYYVLNHARIVKTTGDSNSWIVRAGDSENEVALFEIKSDTSFSDRYGNVFDKVN